MVCGGGMCDCGVCRVCVGVCGGVMQTFAAVIGSIGVVGEWTKHKRLGSIMSALLALTLATLKLNGERPK
jgi:hypothetical protein